MKDNWKIETKMIQAGWQPKNGEPRVLPIYQSTTYKYDTAEAVANLFDLKAEGHMYSRISNPTVDAYENKMAALEGGVAALAVSSGQTASFIAIANLCTAGEHFIAVSTLYGGTVALFTNTFKKIGVEVDLVDPELSIEELKEYIRPNTKCIFGETIANPGLEIFDFDKFSNLAKESSLPLIIDNTFATPYFCRPLELGAHIVIHSSTKYIDGHATAVGGVIVDGGNYDWSNGRFPEFVEPEKSYHGLSFTEKFGAAAYIVRARVLWVRDIGGYMTPMNAFLSNMGLETLHLRMERHFSNARKLAEFLQKHEKVAWVKYPGLQEDKYYSRAQKYLPKGCCGVLSFGVKGGRDQGEKVMNSLELAAIVVHVSDLRTSVLHPASMTHRQLSEAEQEAAGVSPDLIRVSVGIENIEDIVDDFAQALQKI